MFKSNKSESTELSDTIPADLPLIPLTGTRPNGSSPRGTKRLILGLGRNHIRFRRNQVIYREGDAADDIHIVVSGIVRTCRALRDGRRRIAAFHYSGEFLDLSNSQVRALSAEAVTEVTVTLIKRSALLALAAQDCRVANLLFATTTLELRRIQNHALLLTRSAEGRLAGFLVDLAERMKSSKDVELPMTREEIADYLGLTFETVSRTFSQIERSGAIARKNGRLIAFRSRRTLRKMIC